MVVMSGSSVVIVRMSSVMVVSPFHTGQGRPETCGFAQVSRGSRVPWW